LPFCHTLTTCTPKRGYPKQLNHLGDHLRKRRLDLGLTQQEVATQLGVNKDSIRNWEAGRNKVELRYYPLLFAFLGYNPLPEATTRGEAIRRERVSRGGYRSDWLSLPEWMKQRFGGLRQTPHVWPENRARQYVVRNRDGSRARLNYRNQQPEGCWFL